MNLELDAKRLGLLCEFVPGAARIGVLVNPSNSVADKRIKNLQVAAASIGRHIEVFPASTTGEIDAAFVKLAQKPVDALVVAPGPYSTDFAHNSLRPWRASPFRQSIRDAPIRRGWWVDELRNERGGTIFPRAAPTPAAS